MKQLLIWRQKIPFQMFPQSIQIDHIHQFNAVLDEIFFAWGEKNFPS